MAGAKDKKKKPKLTKAEREKLKKEEAERKAKEEEEAKLIAEQAEREREEQERIEAEERRLLEETERVRHQAEIDELNEQLEVNKQYLVDQRKSALQQNKWDRYMQCDGRPDPTTKKEINSFINLLREDASELSLEKVLKKCELILELIEELDRNIAEQSDEMSLITNSMVNYTMSDNELSVTNSSVMSIQDNRDNVEEINARNTLKSMELCIKSLEESKEDLQKLIGYKIDQATLALLKSPGSSIDPDDLNIECCEETDHLKICIWGNSAKNPRVKQVSFGKDPFTMELPKQMALLDIAVRVLYMKFDPFSSQCSYYHMRPPKTVQEQEVPLAEIGIELEQPSQEDVQQEITEDLKSTLSAALSTKSALGKNKSRLGGLSSASSTHGSNKNLSALEESMTSSKLDLPEAVETVAEEDIEDLIEEDVIDLRLYSTTGSLMYVELLGLPPQAKEVNGWIMQQVIEGGLPKIPFGGEPDHSSLALNKSTASMSSKPNTPLASGIGYNLPILLSIKVDEKVIFHEDPLIARWDEPSLHWKIDGITDSQYTQETGVLSFRSVHFGPFAIMQDKYCNLPFQSWHLYPKALNECVLNLVGNTIEVNILIKEGNCCIEFPGDVPQAEHIAHKWMKPRDIITSLQSVGINFFPSDDGHKYVQIFRKVDGLVIPLYQYMALLASCFSFTFSKWNTECGEEKFVMQALEWMTSEIPSETSHHLYVATTRICYKLNMNEGDEEFSQDVDPNFQMHPDLYHTLRGGAGTNAKKLMQDTSVVFIDCVHQLLSASKVLVYS